MMRIRPFVGAICAVSLAAGVTLYGCQAADNPEQTTSSETPQEQAQPQEPQESTTPAPEESQPEPEAPKLSEEIIGVWQSDDVSSAYVAFDGEKCFFTGNGVYSTYSTNDETGLITIGLTGQTMDASVEGDILTYDRDGKTYSFARTSDNPAQFITENRIVLKAGESWENDAVMVDFLSSDYYGDGQIPISGNRIMYHNEPTFAFICDIANMTELDIDCAFDFIINGKTKTTGSISGGWSLNPFAGEETIFTYDVPEKNTSSIETLEVLFAYRDTKTGELVTPWITLSLS